MFKNSIQIEFFSNRLINDYQQKYENTQDSQIVLPDFENIKYTLEDIIKDFDSMNDFVSKFTMDKELLLAQTNITSRKKQNDIVNDYSKKFSDLHELMLLGTSKEQFDSNEQKSDTFQELIRNSIVQLLTVKCGFDVKIIDFEQRTESVNMRYLMKIRINKDSLLQQASRFNLNLPINFQGSQMKYVILENADEIEPEKVDEKQFKLSNSIYDLMAKDDIKSQSKQITDDLMKLNEKANDQLTSDELKNPCSKFLEKFPQQTTMPVNSRINPKLATELFLTYPFNRNEQVRKIKFDQARLRPKDEDDEEGYKIEVPIETVNWNPYMTNFFEFSFGLPKDAPDEVKMFPQDLRIDMCTDIIEQNLNLDYLVERSLINDFDGLHQEPDRQILNNSVGKLDTILILFRLLSRRDILIIKHYWGTEIASYFFFLNHLNREIFILGTIGLIIQLVFWFFKLLQNKFFLIFLKMIYGVLIVVQIVKFLRSYREKEKLQKSIWGAKDNSTSDENPSIVTSYKAPQKQDIFKKKFVPNDEIFNIWRYVSWGTILILFGLMTQCVGILLELKNKNFNNVQGTYYGIGVSLTIKIFQLIWKFFSEIFRRLENQKFQSQMQQSTALKDQIFNYFNLLYNFQYILYLQKQVFGQKCYTNTVQSIGNSTIQYESCKIELENQLLINILVQMSFNFVEIGLPLIKQWYFSESIDVNEDSAINHLIKDSMDDLSEDQIEVVIQLTMVQTFGMSFPICIFLIFLSFSIETRVDLYKQINLNKRGECKSTKGIGIWIEIIEIGSLIAINNNVLTIVMEFQEFDKGFHIAQDTHLIGTKFSNVFAFGCFIGLQYLCQTIWQGLLQTDSKEAAQNKEMFRLNKLLRKEVEQKQFDFDGDDSNDILTTQFIKMSSGNLKKSTTEFD